MHFISYTGEPEKRRAAIGNIDLTISLLVSTIMNVRLLRSVGSCAERSGWHHCFLPEHAISIHPYCSLPCKSLPLYHASYPTQQAGVDSICRELDSLRQLVHTAARAATETGVTMPSTDKAHRHTSIYRKLPSVTVLGTYCLIPLYKQLAVCCDLLDVPPSLFPGESMRFKPSLERNEVSVL